MTHGKFSSGNSIYSAMMLLLNTFSANKIFQPMFCFSRLVQKPTDTTLNQILVPQCTDDQRAMIKENHKWLHAHSGVDRTILHLTQRHPLETSKDRWPNLRQDVRQYIQSCVTCQKMTTRNQIIRAFVTSTLKPMQRIAMDTIGPFTEAMTFKFIIVLTDTFTH